MSSDVVRLSDAPDLKRLFLRAVLAARRSGSELADTRYELGAQPIDVDQLVAYQRVCGFRIGDVLPSTFVQLLAFPLAMARMTAPDFPLPVVGMVHVANSITQLRPVQSTEALALGVRAANMRAHAVGTQVDLIAEAHCGEELVWIATATYLRREQTPATGDRPRRPSTSAPTGTVSEVRVPSDIGRRYSAVSADFNLIHMSKWGAKLFGFPRAIAHGMWVHARVLASLEGRLPAAYTVDVAFKTPVFLPSTICIRTPRTESGWDLDVRSRSGKPHLSGTVR